MDIKHYYDYIIKMQCIARIGLKFATDPYARDNYQEINDLSMKMLEDFENIKFDRPNYFDRNIYPTPSISVRTIVKNDKSEILFVREAKDNTYSLPGGWCDLYDSPSQAAKNEVSQEAGVEIEITRLVGILNHTPFKNDKSIPEYVLIFEGKIISKFHEHCYETNDVKFFSRTHLPTISRKNSLEELNRVLDASEAQKTIFD
jgi:8-oxo-dGTP diphosphatase